FAGRSRPGDDFGLGDIFSDLFGGMRGRRAEGDRAAFSRGRDVRYTLEMDFLEAAAGAKKRVTMPDGGVLDLTVPEGVADGQGLARLGWQRARGCAGRNQGGAAPAIHPQRR